MQEAAFLQEPDKEGKPKVRLKAIFEGSTIGESAVTVTILKATFYTAKDKMTLLVVGSKGEAFSRKFDPMTPRMFEYGSIRDIFEKPANPYTMGLLSAFPSITGPRRRLQSIPGSPPDLANPPSGCRFHPRCQFAQEVCKFVEPPMVKVAPDHWSQCHFAEEIYRGSLKGG